MRPSLSGTWWIEQPAYDQQGDLEPCTLVQETELQWEMSSRWLMVLRPFEFLEFPHCIRQRHEHTQNYQNWVRARSRKCQQCMRLWYRVQPVILAALSGWQPMWKSNLFSYIMMIIIWYYLFTNYNQKTFFFSLNSSNFLFFSQILIVIIQCIHLHPPCPQRSMDHLS